MTRQSNTARRALAAARRSGDQPGGARRTASPPLGATWSARMTHAELDALAAAKGVTFDAGATKTDKQAALTAAGVPEG